MNYCLMCGRIQPKEKKAKASRSRKGHRLTKEERKKLLQEIQCGLTSKDFNMQELALKYNVDRKTVAYWKKKISKR